MTQRAFTMNELNSLALAQHKLADFSSFFVLPFVVKILQHVPLRRHLRRGAVALLLFEVPGDIFHGCGT